MLKRLNLCWSVLFSLSEFSWNECSQGMCEQGTDSSFQAQTSCASVVCWCSGIVCFPQREGSMSAVRVCVCVSSVLCLSSRFVSDPFRKKKSKSLAANRVLIQLCPPPLPTPQTRQPHTVQPNIHSVVFFFITSHTRLCHGSTRNSVWLNKD